MEPVRQIVVFLAGGKWYASMRTLTPGGELNEIHHGQEGPFKRKPGQNNLLRWQRKYFDGHKCDVIFED